MNLRQMSWGAAPPASSDDATPSTENYLTQLIDGVTGCVPEIDPRALKILKGNVSKLAPRIGDRLADDDRGTYVRAILSEFEAYRASSEMVLRKRQTEWRAVVDKLFRELLTSLGMSTNSSEAAQLAGKIASLSAIEELVAFRNQIDAFLHPLGSDGSSPFNKADRSTANDNAAGLRGGGSALEHVQRIMDSGSRGYLAIFRLGCLDIIGERFGLEAVQDAVMAISAFLTQNLRSDDAIYHWSDSSLLVILQGRANEQVLNAELRRIAARNRDISVTIDGRTIMLRVPIDYKLLPIAGLRTTDDLRKLSEEHANQEFAVKW